MNNNGFFKDGYTIFTSTSIKKKIKLFEQSFSEKFTTKFKNNNNINNRNLIKRVAGDLSIFNIMYDKSLINFIKSLNLTYPIQSGPLVTHYTSNNDISKSYGIPFHQDWPSMSSSKNSIIVWLNINNFLKNNGHGIEIMPKTHKKIQLGNSTDKGYEVDVEKLKKFKRIIIQPKYEILIMSSFLVHRSHIDKNLSKKYWRLGISTRFDDLECKFWKKNQFISAYKNIVDRDLYKKTLD